MYTIFNTKTGEFLTIEVDNEDAVAGFASESAAFTYMECMGDEGADYVPYALPDLPVAMMH